MSEIIIVPGDNDTEQLRKSLKESLHLHKMLKDPRQRLFDEYRSAGFDSETAAALSDLTSMDTMAQANTVLEAAARQITPSDIRYVTAVEVPQALKNIGATAGAAVGSAAGLSIIKAAVRHSSSLMIVGITAGGVVGATFAGKFVATMLGKAAAIATAANILSAAGFIALAFFKQRKTP